MIEQHAALARRSPNNSACRRRAGSRGLVVRTVGRQRMAGGGAGRRRSDRVAAWRSWPSSSRSRTGWVVSTPPLRWPTSAPARSSTPSSHRCCAATPTRSSPDSSTGRVGGGDRRRAGAGGAPGARPSSTPHCSRSATFVDLKSPYTLGHARAVSRVGGRRAARQLGLADDEVADAAACRAGARLSGAWVCPTPSGTKPGPLGAGEWERIRMHPYLTQRMLHQSPALAPLGAIAVQHRERLDGSGYPRGLSGGSLISQARLSSRSPTRISRCVSCGPYRAGADRRRGRVASCARGEGGAARRYRGRRGARRRRSCGAAAPRGSCRSHARARCDVLRLWWPVAARAKAHRQAARHLAQDRAATTSSTSTRRSAPPIASPRAVRGAARSDPRAELRPTRRRLKPREDGAITS